MPSRLLLTSPQYFLKYFNLYLQLAFALVCGGIFLLIRIGSSSVTLILVVFCLVCLLGSLKVTAQVITPFQIRYTTNTEGDIAIFGNEILTCPSSNSRCAQAQEGAALNNNIFDMIYVDIDNDPSTFNSSKAYIRLPDGAEVLYAGLYWGADVSDTSLDTRDNIKLKSPGDTTYKQLTGTVIGTRGRDYHSFVDVTSTVKSAGNGIYTVADITANTGRDAHGGWALVIAYTAPEEPPRNLTILDGFAFVGTSSTVDVSVGGFLTPAQGPVNTRLGIVAYEGDRGVKGETLQLNSTFVGDSINPTDNFFNSTISRLGNKLYERTPDYDNTLGFDADVVDASGILPNNATNAVITMSSNTEVYSPGVVTFSTELFAPKLGIVKAGKNISRDTGTNFPGDTIEYTISVKNTGLDNAKDTVLNDAIPVNTTYVPGSLSIVSGANPGSKTDAAGDDQAEFDSVNNKVVLRIGSGANSSIGGTIATGEETSMKFQVTINADAPDQAKIDNQASISSISETLNQPLKSLSNIVHFFIPRPPSPNLAVEKTLNNITRSQSLFLPGDIVEYTISVTLLNGDFTANNVLQDAIPNYTTYVPDSLQILSGSNAGMKSDMSGDDQAEFDGAKNSVVFRIGLGSSASNGGILDPSDKVSIRFHVRINDNAPDQQNVGNYSSLNYVAQTTQIPGSAQSNTVSFVVKNSPPILNVAKSFANKTRNTNAHYPGDIIEYTIAVKNEGKDNVNEAVLSDFIPSNTTYFPNSLQIIYGVNTGTKTDDPGDDQAEFDPIKNRVMFRIGSGSDSINGGIIAPDEQIIIVYRIKINTGVPNNTVIDNKAQISAVNSITGDLVSQNSNQVLFNIYNPIIPPPPDIYITPPPGIPVTPGGVIESELIVNNVGPTPATMVELTIDVPDGITINSISTTQGTCVGTQHITCSLGNLTANNSIIISYQASVDPSAQPGVLNLIAHVQSAENDSCTDNNSISQQLTIREAQFLHCPKDPR